MADISRRITRKSLKAKRKAAIKTIKLQAKEKIRLVKLECSIDSEQKKSRELEKEHKKELKAQKANARISYNERQPRPFSLGEDLFNSISHGIGAGLSVAAIVLLVIKSVYHSPSGSAGVYVASYSILGAVFFVLYLCSTLSHAITALGGRKVFERLTYSSIYLLLTATATPFALKMLSGTTLGAFVVLSWSLCGILAVLCIILGSKLKTISFVLYMIAVIAGTVIFSQNGRLFLAGSAFYIAGGTFFLLRNYKWSHSFFHLLCLAGSIFHFFAVYYLI